MSNKDKALFKKLLRDPAFVSVCADVAKVVTGSEVLGKIHPHLWDGRHSAPKKFLAELARGESGDAAFEPFEKLLLHKLALKCGNSESQGAARRMEASAQALFGADCGGVNPVTLGLSVDPDKDTVYYAGRTSMQCFYANEKTIIMLIAKSIASYFNAFDFGVAGDLFKFPHLPTDGSDSSELTGEVVFAKYMKGNWSVVNQANNPSALEELCAKGKPLCKLLQGAPMKRAVKEITKNQAFQREVLSSVFLSKFSRYPKLKREFDESTSAEAEDRKMPAVDGSRRALPRRVTQSPRRTKRMRKHGEVPLEASSCRGDENESVNATRSV